MDDLLADFLAETTDSLSELDVALVRLERTPDDAPTLSLIFRLVHTIKGTCGFLGLPRLEGVAHAAESVLARVRDGTLPVAADVVSHILAALDRIRRIVAGLAANGTEPTGDDTSLIAALAAIADEPVALAVPGAGSDAAAGTAGSEPGHEVPPPPAGTTPTIRVALEVLENLMTLAGELVLTRNQLLQLARQRPDSGFTVPLQRLSQITSDLQEGVMKTRMQPIGTAWNKLPRLVRDLASDLGKNVDLRLHGAETELDRQVLELIRDPLTHMVRNAIDHGLEAPAGRRAAGKAETGVITLNAWHEGGHIFIEISDDGAGLPLDRIRAKALSRGLVTEAELAAMTDEQVRRFIFHAGFSTAAAVTAVSGRGVGMDVVRTNIERIGGTIGVRAAAGGGTTFTIKIPLTLAIVSALIVAAGGERFAIPQVGVSELVRAGRGGARADGEGHIEQINRTPLLRLRDRLLPLVALADLLRLDAPPPEGAAAGAGTEESTIVVTNAGGAPLGIIVDRVFDAEEVVVKPVAPILRHITMFSGNTILGDGSVIMVLDPSGIARATGVAAIGGEHGRSAAMPASPAGETTRSDEPTALLLFRAGGPSPRAVPLGLVARLEEIARERIEFAAGGPVTQYRGGLMPLVSMGGPIDPARARHPVLVFTNADRAAARDGRAGPVEPDRGMGPARRDRCVGLVVDEIVDVVEDVLRVVLSGDRPGLLGTSVIAGQATDVIDTAHWLTQGFDDWFHAPARAGGQVVPRLLVVEDSDFFRQLLMPMLSAAGYEVVGASGGAEAVRLREAGEMFDAIVSDIEMPGLDGLELVRRIRAGGAWADLPVIALSGRAGPADIAAGRAAGFTDHVGKFERHALLASLRRCLGPNHAAGRAVLAAATP